MLIVKITVNLLFFLLELAALASFGYWGFQVGKGGPFKFLLGIGAPLLIALFWGTFVAPKASIPVSLPIRALFQSLVFLAAAVSLYAAGRSTLAVAFIATAFVVMALTYALKL